MATAAPAAPAPAEEGAEAKPKSKLVPLILAVTALIVVIVATIGLTLWLSGFFAKPPVNADALLEQDAEHGAAADGGHGAPADAGHGEKPADGGHGAPAEGGHGEKPAEGEKPSGPPALIRAEWCGEIAAIRSPKWISPVEDWRHAGKTAPLPPGHPVPDLNPPRRCAMPPSTVSTVVLGRSLR